VMIARWVSFMVTGELPGDPDASDSTV
jgi:hypothetical protein